MRGETEKPYPIAILCDDLHFSHDVPLARAETRTEWYACMAGYCKQLTSIAGPDPRIRFFHSPRPRVPIICAGDVLHKWDSPPELVNFLIKHMPMIYSVAGNHDLPFHSLENIRRSAYWTLVEADKIRHLDFYKEVRYENEMQICGFSCGQEIRPPLGNIGIWIAVIHDYIWWTPKDAYKGAPREKQLRFQLERLKGYDVALFGDNHSAICYNADKEEPKGNSTVFNAGTFMRRRSDERSHEPHVGILYSDGSIKRKYLDTSKDKWREEVYIIEENLAELQPNEVAETLRSLSDVGSNFSEAIRRAASLTDSKRIRAALLLIAEEAEQ